MTNLRKNLIAVALAGAVLPVVGLAAPVTFNAGGIETVTNITAFDWGPSNVIAVNGNSAFVDYVTSPSTGNDIFGNPIRDCSGQATKCQFQIYAQGSLLAFQGDPTNQLNSAYEITFEMAFGETVTDGKITPTSNTADFSFGWTDGTPDNYFRMFFDPLVDADDLAGTGFTNGTMIMDGTIKPSGVFTSSFKASTEDGSIVPIGGNISVNGGTGTPAAWNGTTTVSGSGSSSKFDLLSLLDINVDSYDSTFFLTELSQFLMTNVSQQLPFTTVDPSLTFLSGTIDTQTAIGTQNGGTTIDFDTGAITADAPSIIFQTDPNSPVDGTTIPEPGSLALLGIGLLGMAAGGRRINPFSRRRNANA